MHLINNASNQQHRGFFPLLHDAPLLAHGESQVLSLFLLAV